VRSEKAEVRLEEEYKLKTKMNQSENKLRQLKTGKYDFSKQFISLKHRN